MQPMTALDMMTADRDRVHAAHCETIRLLGRVVSGDLRPEWVKVDVDTMNWSFAVPQPPPTETPEVAK